MPDEALLMLWLSFNLDTGEGRTFGDEATAWIYAALRGWKRVWVGLVA
jgi:hypothetical protein